MFTCDSAPHNESPFPGLRLPPGFPEIIQEAIMQSVFEQDLERLVKQYDQPGPRYTSYPTVPVWPQGSFGREYAEALEAEGTKDRGISIYLHIPFCRTLCTFCGCNKVITRDAELVERYLKALEQEMTAVAKGLGQRKTLSQLHLGGGTPTFLSLDQLTRLTEMLKHHFEIDPEGEWALEANPRVTTAEQLEGLFDLGFRRVSFGIQDIDPAVQRAINRNQTSTQSEEAFSVSKKLGYQSINFDLVYGLPLQTRVKFRKTLDAVSKMRRLCEGVGAMVEEMDINYHDKVLAITSHLPHLIAYTIVGTADDLEDQTQADVIRFSASGFRDFTRIAASDPVMWRDIFLNNQDAHLEVLGRFTEELFSLQRAIRKKDGEYLLKYFKRTRSIRKGIVAAGQDTGTPNFGRD